MILLQVIQMGIVIQGILVGAGIVTPTLVSIWIYKGKETRQDIRDIKKEVGLARQEHNNFVREHLTGHPAPEVTVRE